MKKLYSLFFAVAIISLSCEENISTECVTCLDLPATGELVTFTYIQENIFDVSCASSGCHGETNPQANLILTSSASYSNLVGVNSLLNPNFKRVEASNSQNSFLIKMLVNSGEGTSQMPPSSKLNEALIDSVSAWIDRGAKND